MDENLLDYIGQSLIQGISPAVIRSQLISVGWDLKQIDEALEKLVPKALPQSNESVIVAANDNPNAQPYIVKKVVNYWPIVTGLVIGFIIVGAIVVGALFIRGRTSVSTALPTPPPVDETSAFSQAGWQTYTNTEYRFSMKIPRDWSVKEYSKEDYGEGEQRIAFGLTENLPTEYFNEGPYIWMKIYPVTNELNYKDYTYFLSEVDKGKITKTSLGGNSAINSTVALYTEKNGYVYELYLNSENNSGERLYTEQSNLIWNSFKFTE
jgi:hypothetical protein